MKFEVGDKAVMIVALIEGKTLNTIVITGIGMYSYRFAYASSENKTLFTLSFSQFEQQYINIEEAKLEYAECFI